MSAKIPLPERIFSHGFVNYKGEKMSKSLGNVILPQDLIGTYGADQVRYFFLREVPFGQDGNYTHEAIVNRINADLANDLGNLAQRSLSMIAKNCASKIPRLARLAMRTRNFWRPPRVCFLFAVRLWPGRPFIRPSRRSGTLAEANRYFAAQEPWSLKKRTRSAWELCCMLPRRPSPGGWRF